MPKVPYPHTMVRGRFRGRTFATQMDYQNALRASKAHRALPHHQGPSTSDVRRIVDVYELLMAEGVGKAKAVRLIEAMLEA